MIDKIKKGSWKTTTASILVAIAAVCLGAKAYIDGDPSTTPNITEIGTALMGLAASLGLWNAKDDSKKEASGLSMFNIN